MEKQKLSWVTTKRVVDVLLPYGKNPRKLSDKQLKDLKKSLEKFNLVEIPAIDIDDRIIAGHQRLKVLQILGRGKEEIDVRIPNRKLTEEEYKRYLISSNAISGDWDPDLLKDFDLDLLLGSGFDGKELDDLWAEDIETKGDDFDEYKELAEIKTPETKQGDIIELGHHRLICGDSTDPEVLQKLFGEDRAQMVYSDPVYNIGLSYNKGLGGKQNYGGNVIDDRTDEEYKNLIKSSLSSALSVTHENAHIFYWCDETYIWLIQTLYRELGINNKRVCLWVKNGHNPTPSVAFNKCYEPCVYGVRGKPYLAEDIQDLNEVLNKETGTGNKLFENIKDFTNLWAAKRMSSDDYEHATSKPPELHEKAILKCTKVGDIILDSFSGSGSTIIAGEMLKRKVYAVELEPIFCDLTIRRYEKLTGKKAVITRDNEKA
jgi:DNA modification methylase